MERTVRYFREGYTSRECDGYREEPFSTFLYDLPHLTACNVFPPLHILNTILLEGKACGHSPDFVWDPFEILEQEYQEILPKLLNPDWMTLRKKLWRFRLPIKHDPEFHYLADRFAWMTAVCEKYGSKSLEEMGEMIEQLEKECPEWYQAYNLLQG